MSVATPTSVAKPSTFIVQDVYGNIWNFTESKYEKFTRQGIQLKRLVRQGVWRRNEPWKKTVDWDAVDEKE